MYINWTETGKRVRSLRMAQGLTQEELADSSISPGTITAGSSRGGSVARSS